MAEVLFRIDDAFTIRGRGVVVAGRWAEPAAGHVVRIGDAVAVVRADGTRLRTTIRGVEAFARAHPPGEYVAILLSSEVGQEDVAAGGAIIRVDGSGDPR